MKGMWRSPASLIVEYAGGKKILGSGEGAIMGEQDLAFSSKNTRGELQRKSTGAGWFLRGG